MYTAIPSAIRVDEFQEGKFVDRLAGVGSKMKGRRDICIVESVLKTPTCHEVAWEHWKLGMVKRVGNRRASGGIERNR